VADRLGAELAQDPQALLASGVDGFVIATATPGHAPLLRLGVGAGVPTFCEKPVAATLDETLELRRLAAATDVPVHVGFQRRFDRGYRRVARAVADGELGFVHSVRAGTHDQAPPHAAYVPTSGGLFRDCSIHDFDIIRFVTGREVASVYAVGANKGAPFFSEAGDVDTAAALLTLDDDTLVTVTATRYNGAGHDVRMEVIGSLGTLGVGYDSSLAVTSAEEGVDFPSGPRHSSFMERFLPAYRAELTAFASVAAGRLPSPCTVDDALQAFRVAEACELSRAEGRPVALSEIRGAEPAGVAG
jgi:myo-inositol 2-dehydrogenase/D-chiro-inositol 1-dehydrogenase